MSRRSSVAKAIGTGQLLDLDGLTGLCEQLAHFRRVSLDAAGTSERRMLYFVQGLRFSAEIIYVIRRLLVTSVLSANWGHLLRGDDVLCSPECDVILHRDGKRGRWNGTHKDPVFDFWFVDPRAVRAVISCKSVIRKPSDVDRQYCQKLRNFGVSRIWLFAECCDPSNVGAVAGRARSVGYSRFFHLYTLDPRTGSHTPSEKSWNEFIRAVRGLERERRSRQPPPPRSLTLPAARLESRP